MAKRILKTMRVGDVVVLRPSWVVAFHNAARREGMRLRTASFRRDGVLLFRAMRIAYGAPSGHAFARLPQRDRISGRWLRDGKAVAA